VCLSESGHAVAVPAARARNKATAPHASRTPRRSEVQQKENNSTGKSKPPRRRSFFGSSGTSQAPPEEVSPSSDSVGAGKPKSQRGRDGVLGGSASSTADTIGPATLPSLPAQQGKQEIRHDERRSEVPKSQPSHSVYLAVSMSSNQVAETAMRREPKRRFSLRSSSAGDATISSSNQTVFAPDDGRAVAGDVATSKKPPRLLARRNSIGTTNATHPSSATDGTGVQPPRKSPSIRRYSLTGGDLGSHAGGDCAAPTPASQGKPRSQRRHSMMGWGNNSSSNESKLAGAAVAVVAPDTSSEGAGSHSNRGGTSDAARPKNPYDLLNKERTRRSLPPFSRSMLLDSIARDVAQQLARSAGKKCTPTDYHGNVGKGVDFSTIHKKMMAQRGTEKANIVSSKFTQVGIGMSKTSDGQIFVCQLFE
jgi:Cysteine-rich secretory protein family